ncbi:Energy-coupling factor transporter transmembrane protein EcfT [Candidatus Izimaplasma bacterium HR1]|uniref:energy-coupling factor transporter transmembrane component T family protein n=1 Tax=Candidatus Izimoplasma sp. HR1 TaxID=1541959 RepID=UPI0004F5971B|nr:Energy-coupling factor transporter transmembrane protein EcfT [Candidatus Izimaplasma bacterium HR1]
MSKKGIISRMYPLAKLSIALILGTTSIIVQTWQFGYMFLLPLTMFLALIDGRFWSYFKKVLSVSIIFFSFIFLIQAFLVPEGAVMWEWKFLVLTEGGLNNALSITSVILSFLTTLLLVFETTNISDLMVSLQKTGMPNGAAYVFLASLQMIPQMNKRSKVIMQAQRARGIETEGNLLVRIKAFVPTLSPLIISSITDIGDKAQTLEARAFSATCKNTFYRQIKANTLDKILPVVVGLLCIAYIVWTYVPALGGM